MAICSMPKPEEFEKLSSKDFLYLNKQGSMSGQIYRMTEMIMMPDSEIYEKREIVAQFIDLLKPYYPDCDVIVFGSSANGFGFKGCDLDLLFLPFPDYSNFKFKDKECGVVPKPHLIRKGTVSRNMLLDMDERMHLKFVQRITYITKFFFEKVIFIPARCPILNIKLLNSSVSCDFSASNRTVVYNTELLRLFGELDVCVKPLVMVLRYWAKSLGLVSKITLSSYCFTLMVIFFLQNTYPAILPPVKFLNELAGYSRIVDGWDTAVCLDTSHIMSYAHENKASIGQLFKDFFKFYWEFDFVNNVVSPYYGRAVPVKELKESKDERIKCFQVSPFSIQDPFILSRNLDRCPTKLASFKLALLIAKKLLLRKELSHQLFLLSYYEQEMTSMFSSTKINLHVKSVFIPVQLTYEMCIKLKMTSLRSYDWFKKIYQTVLDILQQGLCIECEVVDIDKALLVREAYEPPAKRQKVNNDGDWSLQLIISMQCFVNFPTIWKYVRTRVLGHVHTKTDNCSDNKKSNQLNEKLNEHSSDNVDIYSIKSVINEENKQSIGEVDNCSDDKKYNNSNYKNNDNLHNKVNVQLTANKNNAVHCKVEDHSSDVVNKLCEIVNSHLNDNKNVHSCEDVDDESDDEEEIYPSLIKDYRISKKLIKSSLEPVSSAVTDEKKLPYLTFLCNFYKYPDSSISDIIIGFSPLTNEKIFCEVKDFLQSFVRKHIKNILEKC